MTSLHHQIRSLLQASKHILIVSHIRPDGDAVGSMLALGLALQNAGRKVQMVLSDGVPDSLRHLPGSGQVVTLAKGKFDLVITVDCSDLKRTGSALGGRPVDIAIDHHHTNGAFARYNLVDERAVATCSILMRSMPEWGLIIDTDIASSLLTGLITDTLGFRTPNTTPEALRQAAELMELGADMSRLYFAALDQHTYHGARYWGAALSGLQMEDGILWASLSLTDRKTAGYKGNDDADLIDVLSSIHEADIAIMFVEQSPEMTKASWRTHRLDLDVSAIAKSFGGGGHKPAAGAQIEGSLDDVRERVLAATRDALKEKI